MRWFPHTTMMVGACLLLGLTSCGSSGFDNGGTDALTMQFLGFSDEGIDQQDSVGTTNADVDVCASLCNVGGDLIDIEFEQFTTTSANAIFMNMGSSPILLDTYTVAIPGSGIPTRTGNISVILPGGQCSNSTAQCGDDSACNVVMGHTDDKTMGDLYTQHVADERLLRVAEHVRGRIFAKRGAK